MKQQKSNKVICTGQFSGGEIEPGTFHGGEIEPGTFHNFRHAQDVASRADDAKPKNMVKESSSDSESSEEAETSSGNGESRD